MMKSSVTIKEGAFIRPAPDRIILNPWDKDTEAITVAY